MTLNNIRTPIFPKPSTPRPKPTPSPRTSRTSPQDVREALSDYANRVVKRMEHAPRFQSIGRRVYVYVGDVKQVLDEELGGGE